MQDEIVRVIRFRYDFHHHDYGGRMQPVWTRRMTRGER